MRSLTILLFMQIVDAKRCNPIHNSSRYIVECSTDVQPPAYLRRRDTYNLSSIAHPDCKDSILPFHSLKEDAWPRMEELGLDESQMRALQLALTKELAIIQGPPGTGEGLKSHCWKDDLIHLWMKSVTCISHICKITKSKEMQSFTFLLKYMKIRLLCFFHFFLRKNLRWPEDCSGSVDQSGSLERWI